MNIDIVDNKYLYHISMSKSCIVSFQARVLSDVVRRFMFSSDNSLDLHVKLTSIPSKYQVAEILSNFVMIQYHQSTFCR